jgi:hypothetical protein
MTSLQHRGHASSTAVAAAALADGVKTKHSNDEIVAQNHAPQGLKSSEILYWKNKVNRTID